MRYLKLLPFALLLLAIRASAASPAAIVNELGTAGAPVSVLACPTVTKIMISFPNGSSYSFQPEGADIRCEPRTAADGAAPTAPTATVGALFKSNVWMTEQPSLTVGDGPGHPVTLGLDCCGVAGAVPTDTWHE